MTFKKKISLMLVAADILIIVMVVLIKSNVSVNSVEKKSTVAAGNVLVKSDDALDTYKDTEIEEYITEKKEEEAKVQTEAEQQQAAQELVDQTNQVATTVAIDANNGNTPSAPIPDTAYSDVASYAVQFVGNPYVAGGTSLTNGADCSGFVMSVYANFGVSLPRTAPAQASVGTSVPLDQIQAGDIVSYGYNGNVSHSALYIGNNTIVHASTPSLGIRTDSMYIMPIVSVRRVS